MRIFFVSHTHWDREWYLTREKSRTLLIDLMDELFSILQDDPGFTFMLDGQTIALKDYLEVVPENGEILRRHVASGRISVGPWYILPDEFLVSGESHIRNYLAGQRHCRELGASMQIGYLPDSFGHPSQMPQILAGLGMGEMIFWRGLGPETTRTEVRWEGKDGTEILGVNTPFSYGIAACMPEDPEAFVRRLRLKIGMLAPLTDGDVLLLMNGVDHVAPQRLFAGNLRQARAMMTEHELIHGSLADYLAALRGQDAPREKVTGELRSGFRAYLLGGTISTRMYLKQTHFRAERLLENYAEPLATLAELSDPGAYPAAELRHAWELLLSNAPHDSICGCGVDAIHEEMMQRYRFLDDLGTSIVEKAGKVIFGEPTPGSASGSGRLAVFNPLLQPRSDVVHASILVGEQLLRKVNYETGNLDEYRPAEDGLRPTGILLRDPESREIEGILHSAVPEDTMRLSIHTQPEMFRGLRVDFSFAPGMLPAIGHAEFSYRLTYGSRMLALQQPRLENEYFVVSFNETNASISVTDRRTGSVYDGLHVFEDGGDAGDEYTWSWPAHDSKLGIDPHSVQAKVEADGQHRTLVIQGRLRVPSQLTADRKSRSTDMVDMPVESRITLAPGTQRIDVRTVVRNAAEDHRLRVLFPLGASASGAASEGVFSVDERPGTPRDNSGFKDWVEPPSTNPQKSFVSVHAGCRGLAIANRGLPEHEVFSDERGNAVIALTLLRCVGWLSRPDLLARKGNGGWTIATPGAQCPGTHAFEYSIIPHAGSWREAGVITLARQFAVPALVFLSDVRGAPGRSSFVSVDKPEIVLSALKRDESGVSYILRCWNASGDRVRACFTFSRPLQSAFLTDLAERKGAEIRPVDAAFAVDFGPWKIMTMALVFRPDGAAEILR
jgi:mannosylglycerate hydrolase